METLSFVASTQVTVERSLNLSHLEQELILGTYDGVAGLVAQPIAGAKREGAKGFAKGICHGVLGLPTKWFAGKEKTPFYLSIFALTRIKN